MTTRFEMQTQVIQQQAERHLERIADALADIAALIEKGIYEGYLGGSDRKEEK